MTVNFYWVSMLVALISFVFQTLMHVVFVFLIEKVEPPILMLTSLTADLWNTAFIGLIIYYLWKKECRLSSIIAMLFAVIASSGAMQNLLLWNGFPITESTYLVMSWAATVIGPVFGISILISAARRHFWLVVIAITFIVTETSGVVVLYFLNLDPAAEFNILELISVLTLLNGIYWMLHFRTEIKSIRQAEVTK